jgi:hypothetical protein
VCDRLSANALTTGQQLVIVQNVNLWKTGSICKTKSGGD